jgi:hypothetical protein
MKMQASDLKSAVQSAEKGSALQALVDGFFAGLEARTTNSIVIGLLKGANKIIDFAMTAYGLALLLSLLFISAATAQQLPRARDTVDSYAGLPRARDVVEVTVATQVDPPCKNCDCGCPEAPCSCDKTKEVVSSEPANADQSTRRIGADVTAPATTPTASAGEEQEAGVSVPAAQPQRFFRYRPAYQRGRVCST